MYTALKFPANAMMVNQELLYIANLNIIDTVSLIEIPIHSHVPEDAAFTLGFEQSGYESKLFASNASFIIWLFISHLCLLILIYGPIYLVNRRTGRLVWLKHKLANYIHWNGLIRLFMETSLEMAITSLLGLYFLESDSLFTFVKYSQVLTILSLVLLVAIPVFLLVLYYRNFAILANPSFKAKYSSALEGTKYDSSKKPSKWILIYLAFFFVRRIIFAVSVVYLRSLWVQVSIQILLSMIV